MNSDYVQYSGTLAWSLGTGVADGALVNALQTNVSSFRLIQFYFERPARMWRRLGALLPSSFSLRPEFCGNFDRSAGRLPNARSEAIALWSRFHERCLSRVAPLLLGLLIIAIVGGILLLLLPGIRTSAVRPWTELSVCLAACSLMAFLTAAFGDAWDNVKHQFLFNLLFDTCLAFAFAGALKKMVGVWGSVTAARVGLKNI